MRILFWGTPDFGVPSLRALQEEGHAVVAVVTQPDRPAGRGRVLRPGPIKTVAEDEGIPVLQPEKPRGEEFLARLRDLGPELSVVAAYGEILTEEVLEAEGSLVQVLGEVRSRRAVKSGTLAIRSAASPEGTRVSAQATLPVSTKRSNPPTTAAAPHSRRPGRRRRTSPRQADHE